MKNYTSKFSIKSAEQELALDPGVTAIGTQYGGMSSFSSTFRRGSGSNVFGVNEEGVWFGSSDFETAPIKFYYSGQIVLTASDGSGNSLVLDSENLRILLFINNIPQALFGYQAGGF